MHEIDPVENWISNVALSHSDSAQTRALYKRGLDYFLKFTGAEVKEISEDYEKLPERQFKHKYGQLVQSWAWDMRQHQFSPGSIGNYVGIAKSFFKYNDFPLCFIPAIRKKVTFHNRDITKEDILNILSVSLPRDKAFYAVMAQSGLRPGTMCALRMKHLEPDYSQNKIPLKISVPEELAKGEYGEYLTFIGEDAVRLLTDYLKTRPNLNRESLVFTNQGTEAPMLRNTISSQFRRNVRMLREKGLMTYEQKQNDRPAEIRLYTLRKWFRKQAIQAGFENVDFWMGHKGPGVDGAYRPKDGEFYRAIYAEKAAPFLRLDATTPLESEKAIEELRGENAELKARLNQLSVSASTLEALLKRVGELEKKLARA